jgi:ribonuclease E
VSGHDSERSGDSEDASGATPERAPQRAERTEAKMQSERFTQKKHPRTPRDEKIRPADEQPTAQEGLQGAQQSEEGGRRRRRGGRQRERAERLDRPVREGKPATTRDSQLEETAAEIIESASAVPALVSTPPPEAPAVETVDLALSVSHDGMTTPEKEVNVHSGSLLVEEVVAVTAPAASEPVQGEPFTGQEAVLEVEELIQKPVHELDKGHPSPASGMLLKPAGDDKTEELEAVEARQEKPVNPIEEPAPTGGQESPARQQSRLIEPLDLVASGLVMVETIPEKIKSAESPPEGEALPQRRRKRVPAPPAVEKDEPLVQVETHK